MSSCTQASPRRPERRGIRAQEGHSLDEINIAYDDMWNGRNIGGLIHFAKQA
jgi:hypothetical protein